MASTLKKEEKEGGRRRLKYAGAVVGNLLVLIRGLTMVWRRWLGSGWNSRLKEENETQGFL